MRNLTHTDLFHRFCILATMSLVAVNPITILAQSPATTRAVKIQAMINLEVGGFLDAEGLSSATSAQIKDFLAQRATASADAVDQALQAGLAKDKSSALVAKARASSDDGIDSAFDPAVAPLVKEIVRNYVAYSEIAKVYVPHMVSAGVPLTGDQMRQLANTLYNCRSALVNSSAPAMRTSIDAATGLSDLDKLILVQVPTYLSPSQVAVLRADLLKASKAIATNTPYTP
jgi:hypothetical protein